MIENEIIKFLDKISEACLTLKNSLQPAQNITIQSAPVQAKEEPNKLSLSEEFVELKKALEGDKWPEAVNPALIVDVKSNEEKTERARGVIELLIDDELKNLKFLDFGCGEGYCAYIGAEYGPTLSVGYDLIKNPQWRKFEPKENTIITNDFGLVEKNGPYDIILLFDILDHVKNEKPVDILIKAKNLLAPTGKIYIRCHPFTSRHATHLYHDMNKAFLHLIFTEAELKQLIPRSIHAEPNFGSVFPKASYEQMIKEAGLVTVHSRDMREAPEEFFKIPLIKNRIIKNTGHKQFPDFQMSLSFIDYVLQKT